MTLTGTDNAVYSCWPLNKSMLSWIYPPSNRSYCRPLNVSQHFPTLCLKRWSLMQSSVSIARFDCQYSCIQTVSRYRFNASSDVLWQQFVSYYHHTNTLIRAESAFFVSCSFSLQFLGCLVFLLSSKLPQLWEPERFSGNISNFSLFLNCFITYQIGQWGTPQIQIS